jgi:hypothetical protein
MATRPRALSNKAIWALEDSRALLSQVKEAIREAQEQNIQGDKLKVGIHLGDIREACAMVDELLAGAYRGEYRK